MMEWAKRVTWQCQRPSETSGQYLARLWGAQADGDARLFWAEHRRQMQARLETLERHGIGP